MRGTAATAGGAAGSYDDRYGSLLADITFRPVFIMGDHRSGTTLLYQLLDASGCFNVVRAYHVIESERLITYRMEGCEAEARQAIVDKLAAAGVNDRVIDAVKASPDLPEEYGFALGEEDPRPHLDDGNLESFRTLCRKVQYLSDPARPLLLKNPWDFGQFMKVSELVPDAYFVFLLREPVDVVNSQIRAARSLYREFSAYHALLDPGYTRMWRRPLRLALTRLLFANPFGLSVTLRHVGRVCDYFVANISSITEEKRIITRYEDLCANPERVIADIVRRAGAGVPADRVPFPEMVKVRSSALLPEVARGASRIQSRTRAFAAFAGYAREMREL